MYAAKAATLSGDCTPHRDIKNRAAATKTTGRPKSAAWGSVPVPLSLLVMLARRHHRLQPQHYTS